VLKEHQEQLVYPGLQVLLVHLVHLALDLIQLATLEQTEFSLAMVQQMQQPQHLI
jgi:hypothetical protein